MVGEIAGLAHTRSLKSGFLDSSLRTVEPLLGFSSEVTGSNLGFAETALAAGGKNGAKRSKDGWLTLFIPRPPVRLTVPMLNLQTTVMVMISCLDWLCGGPGTRHEKVRSVSPGWSGDAGRLGSASLRAGTNYSPGDEAGPIPAALHY